MQHELIKTKTNTIMHNLFLYFKNLHVLKIQIYIYGRYKSVLIKKFKSASKEDANLFYFEEKFRSASKEDADPFYFEEKELITCRSLKLRNKLYQRTIYAIKLN